MSCVPARLPHRLTAPAPAPFPPPSSLAPAAVSTPDTGTWGIFQKDGRTLSRGIACPQTLFVTMASDPWGVAQAPVCADLLKANGIRSAYITVSWYKGGWVHEPPATCQRLGSNQRSPLAPAPAQAPTRQVPPTFFSDRSPVIDPASSALIVGGLQQIGLLGADGWLVADPKLFDVREGGLGAACACRCQLACNASAASRLPDRCRPDAHIPRSAGPQQNEPRVRLGAQAQGGAAVAGQCWRRLPAGGSPLPHLPRAERGVCAARERGGCVLAWMQTGSSSAVLHTAQHPVT